jgi:hypothetical protein
MKTIFYTKTEMESQLLAVPAKMIAAIGSLWSSFTGYVITLTTFSLTYFMPVKELIHVVFALVIADTLFGVLVAIKRKGVSSILSSRLRNSIIKLFVYSVFIAGFFAIETNLIDGYYVTSRIIFAIASGVELWSIAANILILSPNLVFLRIFKKYLAQEMAKKLEMAEDEIGDFLNNKKNYSEDDKKNDNDFKE